MEFRFSGPLWYWRGPSPYHFVTVPAAASAEIEASAREITYGWGMIPAAVRLGGSQWSTSLWPKDGAYLVPVKASVRRAERLELDDVAELVLTVGGNE